MATIEVKIPDVELSKLAMAASAIHATLVMDGDVDEYEHSATPTMEELTKDFIVWCENGMEELVVAAQTNFVASEARQSAIEGMKARKEVRREERDFVRARPVVDRGATPNQGRGGGPPEEIA